MLYSQYFLSKLLYCIASAKWSCAISFFPSKSAIVLATFSILLYALALNPNFSNDISNIFLHSEFNLQYFSIRFSSGESGKELK